MDFCTRVWLFISFNAYKQVWNRVLYTVSIILWHFTILISIMFKPYKHDFFIGKDSSSEVYAPKEVWSLSENWHHYASFLSILQSFCKHFLAISQYFLAMSLLEINSIGTCGVFLVGFWVCFWSVFIPYFSAYVSKNHFFVILCSHSSCMSFSFLSISHLFHSVLCNFWCIVYYLDVFVIVINLCHLCTVLLVTWLIPMILYVAYLLAYLTHWCTFGDLGWIWHLRVIFEVATYCAVEV